MTITRTDASREIKSIHDVKNANERRITVPAEPEAVQVTSDLGMSSLMEDCALLISKHKDNKILSMTSIDVSNMINSTRQYGIYRNQDVVLVSTPYGIVLSGPTSEHTIGVNDTMLNFVFSLVSSNVEASVRLQFSETLECLYYEYTDMMQSQTQFQLP